MFSKEEKPNTFILIKKNKKISNIFNKYYEGENEGIEFCYWLVSLSLAVDILCCVSEAQMPVWLKK